MSRKKPDPSPYPHVESALKYCRDVLSGEVPACKWVKAACQRHLDDLARDGFEYHFDPRKAERVCVFIECLPHIKGRWTGPIKLEPWQCFILAVIFGWVTDKGTRRFRSVYIEVGRKNAKSTMTAGVGLYMLGVDGEPGAEVYSAATTRDQAKAVWEVAKKQAERDPELREAYDIVVQAHSIIVPPTASKYEALSAEGETLDGKNSHFVSVDELHAHKTRTVYDVMETSMGARTQPMMWAITTAGSNRAGICYEHHLYVKRLLNVTLKNHDGMGYKVEGDVAEDERYFGIIYTIDDTDDWTTDEAARKANPNYGVSVDPGELARLRKKAMQLASAQPTYLTKHLNVWVNAGSAWMDMRAWDRCMVAGLKPEDCGDWECWVGLDLAAKVDLAAEVLLFRRRGDDGKWRYRVFGRYWLPEEVVESSGNSQYAGWVRSGILNQCDGAAIDTEEVEAQIRADAKAYKVREVCKDPWNSQDIGIRLTKDRIAVVDVPQNVAHLSEAMKEVEAAVLSGRLEHCGDPVMAWAASNVVAKIDDKENILPTKQQEANKIDPITAMLTAMNRALVVPEKQSYSSRRPHGPLVLG